MSGAIGKFKLVHAETITRDVKIVQVDESEIDIVGCVFKYMSWDEYQTQANSMSNADFLATLVQDWKTLKDTQGNELKYSEEAVRYLAGDPRASGAINECYAQALSGAETKNFSASLALGLAAKLEKIKEQPVKKKVQRKKASKRSASRKK